jgi:hypothetical protein
VTSPQLMSITERERRDLTDAAALMNSRRSMQSSPV